MPVFFIQDAMKFPDLIHAVKPEPHRDAAGRKRARYVLGFRVAHAGDHAHADVGDVGPRHPAHLSHDAGLRRSHVSPRQRRRAASSSSSIGVQSSARIRSCGTKPSRSTALILTFIAAIYGRPFKAGDYPEYELGMQIFTEEQANFSFDVLDPTKIVPEEIVPLTPVGKMVLNRNPDNFFAETEQVAFCPHNCTGH